MSTATTTQPLRIGFVPEHYLLPLHLASRASLFPYPIELTPCPSGTGQMITLLREDKLDLAIGLTEGWVAGLLTPPGQQQQQPQQQRAYSIVGSWVQNPLRWSIVTGKSRRGLDNVADLLRHGNDEGKVKVGVSRMGSGSHVMAVVLAQREGWDVRTQMGFEVLGPLKELRGGVNNGRGEGDGDGAKADFFMWEHFTTKSYWEGEQADLKWLGEIYTPWPSWCVAASAKTFGAAPQGDQRLEQFFQAVDQGKDMFLRQQDECVRLLGTRELGCYYGEEDAREWLKGVKFFDKTEGVDAKMIDEVVEVLKGAGVLAQDAQRRDGDGTVGVKRR